MNITELAEQSLTQPSDTWFGNDLLWYTHGMSGINVHRDSNVAERSNFKVMTDLLTDHFGSADTDGDWWINHSTHWAVGWLDQIMVRVINDPDAADKFSEENISDIFILCMDFIEDLCNSVVIDETDYWNLFHDEMVSEVNFLCPKWASVDFDAEKIISLAYNENVEMVDDESWIIGDKFIIIAAFTLGMFDVDDLDDMIDDIQYVIDSNDYGMWDTTAIAKNLFSDFLGLFNEQP